MTSKGKQELNVLDKSIAEEAKRNLDGSIEQCKEELRDAYMNFKDLWQKCNIDMKQPVEIGKEDHTVFYFKPETFLVDEPEKQKVYREDLLKKVGGIPKPEPIVYLADELHRNFCQTVADRTGPKQSKAFLLEFFRRRQYALQHMKYKLLCRWAHHNMTAETMENMNNEFTFIYGKLEYNLEQAINRISRLDQDDYYDSALSDEKPTTKTADGGSLYVEKFDLMPQSLLREDDVEVYMRGVAYRNKILKTVNKLMSRLKWVPLCNKTDIFERAIEEHFNLKRRNIDRQQAIVDSVSQKCRPYCSTAEVAQELETVLENYYISQYKHMFTSYVDKILHQWKANHDEAPRLVMDTELLKQKILENSAKSMKIKGDIEIDHGFSYSYQVTVLFPSHFQLLILKSQFSLYDEQAGEDDMQNLQKRTLNLMTRIDTNIFRDLSTQKGTVPSDEALQSELKSIDLKVLRLRSAANWIDYCILKPSEPEWHQKQQALLNLNNPVDSLLKAGLNFLDVNDLATVNRINEDNARLHQQNILKLMKNDPHNQVKRRVISQQTSDTGEKYLNIDLMPARSSLNPAGNAEFHLLASVQDHSSESGNKDETSTKINSFCNLPTHLLTAYFTLRYLRSRESKNRILYTLNYFRAVQKRLALDLREFATRDRIEAHQANPFVQAKEANQNIINNSTFAAKALEKIGKKSSASDNQSAIAKNMTVFDESAIKKIDNMASLRQYKLEGFFNQKIMSTCPSYPKFHASHGEPIYRQTVAEEMDRQAKDSLSVSALKLMGRIEFIEINEERKEVYVKDDFGIYIMYDCTLQDMKLLEDELCKIGSYFIHKSEVLLDPTSVQKPVPVRDRLELLQDLLEKEALFQFWKVKLCQVYMECYEHVTDPLEQQKLMQVITDIMARRPRLNLNANYFVDAYDAEIICLEKQFDLIRTVVDLQISLEKTENKRLGDSLSLSYELANQYASNKWKYSDSHELLSIFKKKKEEMRKAQEEVANSGRNVRSKGTDLEEKLSSQESQAEPKNSEGKHSDGGFESEYGQEEENKFTQLLGLPQITLETIYQSYKEKDVNVIKLMSEHSHFIAVHEGYPEFLTRLTHRSLVDKARNFQTNSWSQETGSLDFYETLDFAARFYAVTQQMQYELYDGLKMWDPTLMTQIDIQVALFAMDELRLVLKIHDGTAGDYVGRELVEDEQIMGNSDKMIFYCKEMISDLSVKPREQQDPHVIVKLDLQTVSFYDFPKIPSEKNKYLLRQKGIAGLDYLLEAEKSAIAGIAKEKANAKVKQNTAVKDLLSGNQQDLLSQRNITVPSLLRVYCNMMELHRLRSEIILAAAECSILGMVYLAQMEQVGNKNAKLVQAEGIPFDQHLPFDVDQSFVNFMDHGCAHNHQIDLAIKEFDPTLLSNFNFRNPDAFKLNVLTSGLEEVRAILQYQMLQKHALIVATRLNQLLIDTAMRGQAELRLLEDKKIALPNSIVDYNRLVNRNFDTINFAMIKSESLKFKQQLQGTVAPVIYSISGKKSSNRSMLVKEFSQYQASVVHAMPHNDYGIVRIMRCYKVKLLTRLVSNALNEIYLDSNKIKAVQSCQRLRQFNRLFMCEQQEMGEAILKYETHSFFENFPNNYLPPQFSDEPQAKDSLGMKQAKPQIYKFIQPGHFEISDYFGIPSTATLMQVESSNIEDTRSIKQKKVISRARITGIEVSDELKEFSMTNLEPETHLKQLLPTYTPIDKFEFSGQKKTLDDSSDQTNRSYLSPLDYKEAIYFGDSKYADLTRYYVTLERILTLEWFLTKLQFRPDEVINIDSAIESGCLFWRPDEFDKRVCDMLPELEKADQANKRAQEYFKQKIVDMRSKLNMAQQTMSMQMTLKSFIHQLVKTKPDQRFDYMTSYTEFRFQQIIGGMHKLTAQYYIQGKASAVMSLRQGISQVTRMDHVGIKFYRPNNYSVFSSIVLPNAYALESGNLIYGSIQYEDSENFKRCVKPIVNEKALEPAQLTLFQTMYSHDNLRIRLQSQFAGQSASSVNSIPFRAFDSVLLMLSEQERIYSQSFIVQAKFQANDFMETVYNDQSLKQMQLEEVYSLEQLVDAKRFINESTQSVLLKNALICWHENSTMPDSIEVFNKFESNFRQNYFWKQMEYKDELTRKLNVMNTFGTIPSTKELKEMNDRINKLVNDQSLATEDAVKRRDALVKELRTEFLALKKKVTLDSYFNTKAEIAVYSNEIEKFLIRASVRTLDSETAALAKCFTLQVPSVQFHIHPFQQFAGTFFDQVDPQYHLDVSNKISAVQQLITKMRNRCTQVETLTSGPGIVLTAKDINDILIEFCRAIVKDHEKQFKSRTESAFLKEQELQNALYAKDMRIRTLENRLKRISDNLENVIDARLFEKGNQLIYELDSSTRLLNIFKQTIGDLETNLLKRIYGEQLEKFSRMNNELSLKEIKFSKYQETIMNMVSANFAEEMDKIKKVIKQKADNAKISNKDGVYIPVDLYPHYSGEGKLHGAVAGSIVPKDFAHFTTCNCYRPNPAYPVPTVELVKLETLSEAEARHELARMCAMINKQRLLWLTKDMTTRSKYQDQINHLKKQLSNNTYLWDQLAESQKREKVLRQELLYTQQSLSSAEKTIQNLNEEIKTIDAERGRLQNFKSQNFKKFKELEQRVHQMDLMETVDTGKLLVALTSQHEQLKDVEGVKQIFDSRIRATEERADKEKRTLEKKLHVETTKTQQVIDKMEQMKFELKMLETNDSSVASIWKKKCLDLFEVCQSMKKENDELRERCRELITRGLELAETIDTVQNTKLDWHDSDSQSQNPGLVIKKRSQIMNSFGNQPKTSPLLLEQIKTSKEVVLDRHMAWMTNKQLRPPGTQQHRGRTLDHLESPQVASTRASRKVGGHQKTNSSKPGGHDIRSILSGESFTRNHKKLQTLQPQKTPNPAKKRQTYDNQTVQQQDSLFNQSLGASAALPNQGISRLIGTAVTNPRMRQPQLLSFDLQGKQMPLRTTQSPITSPKPTVTVENTESVNESQREQRAPYNVGGNTAELVIDSTRLPDPVNSTKRDTALI